MGSRSSSASHLRLVPTEPEDLHKFVQEIRVEHRSFPLRRSPRSMRRPVPAQYLIRIRLDHVSTQIWRRIVVTSDLGLDQLHSIVQQAMGWNDVYSHSWWRSGSRYPNEFEEYVASGGGAANHGIGSVGVAETTVRLDEVLAQPGDELRYRYGRLGNWRHTLTLESVDESSGRFSTVCVAGKSACPPEECAGPDEYEQLLSILGSEQLRSHEWTLDWAKTDFDPTQFDLSEVNDRLLSQTVQGPFSDAATTYDVATLVECLSSSQVPELASVLDKAAMDDRTAVSRRVQVDSGARIQSVLMSIGTDGVDIEDFCASVDAMLDEPELGPVNLPGGRSLIGVLKSFGLVRKLKGRIVLTKRGRSARMNAVLLWECIVEGVPVAVSGSQRAVEMLVLLAVAAGLTPSDRHRFVSRALEPIRTSSILMATSTVSSARQTPGSTVEVLGLIGATGYDLGKFGTKHDSPWARDLARAILQR